MEILKNGTVVKFTNSIKIWSIQMSVPEDLEDILIAVQSEYV